MSEQIITKIQSTDKHLVKFYEYASQFINKFCEVRGIAAYLEAFEEGFVQYFATPGDFWGFDKLTQTLFPFHAMDLGNFPREARPLTITASILKSPSQVSPQALFDSFIAQYGFFSNFIHLEQITPNSFSATFEHPLSTKALLKFIQEALDPPRRRLRGKNKSQDSSR